MRNKMVHSCSVVHSLTTVVLPRKSASGKKARGNDDVMLVCGGNNNVI